MILFAKAPVPGAVKTRLEILLGPHRASEFHAACVRDMLKMLVSFRAVADIELHTDTSTDAWPEAVVARNLQAPGDLGLRMFHALERALAAGRPQAMIIGGDAPTLPRAHLEGLLASPADVAFGPAEDGGYYAIACRRVQPEMFRGVDWSTAATLEQSERAARECGLTVARGATWYDIDAPEDLFRLAARAEAPAWLEVFLK